MAWAWATAQVAEHPLQGLMRQCEERMMGLRDTGFHAPEGAPTHLQRCQRGAWEDRMLVETGRSRLTLVGHCKQGLHRVWTYCHARRACTMAAFHGLGQGHGCEPHAAGFGPLSMAVFSL